MGAPPSSDPKTHLSRPGATRQLRQPNLPRRITTTACRHKQVDSSVHPSILCLDAGDELILMAQITPTTEVSISTGLIPIHVFRMSRTSPALYRTGFARIARISLLTNREYLC